MLGKGDSCDRGRKRACRSARAALETGVQDGQRAAARHGLHEKRRGGGAGQRPRRSTGSGVGCGERGSRLTRGKGLREAPQGPAGVSAGGGAGGWGRGGRGPLTITPRSPFPLPPLCHEYPATLDALTQVEGPCGPQQAAASAGGASVARSVPAAPLRRVPPPAPAPAAAAAPPLPVPLPLRQMASGSSAPAPPNRSCSLFTFTLSALAPRCCAPPRQVLSFVLSLACLLPVVYATWVPFFPAAASLNPAFLSSWCDGCHPEMAFGTM
jgi:hypothetical protein